MYPFTAIMRNGAIKCAARFPVAFVKLHFKRAYMVWKDKNTFQVNLRQDLYFVLGGSAERRLEHLQTCHAKIKKSSTIKLKIEFSGKLSFLRTGDIPTLCADLLPTAPGSFSTWRSIYLLDDDVLSR